MKELNKTQLLAAQMTGLTAAIGLMLGEIAGSKARRERWIKITEAQARITAQNFGASASRALKMLALTIDASGKGDALSFLEYESRTRLQGDALDPEQLAGHAAVGNLLKRSAKPRAPRKTPPAQRKRARKE